MITRDTHLCVAVEENGFQCLFGQLQPPDAINEDRFAMRFTGETDYGAASRCSSVYRLRCFAAHRFGAGTPIANGNSPISIGSNGGIVGYRDDRQAQLAAQIME